MNFRYYFLARELCFFDRMNEMNQGLLNFCTKPIVLITKKFIIFCTSLLVMIFTTNHAFSQEHIERVHPIYVDKAYEIINVITSDKRDSKGNIYKHILANAIIFDNDPTDEKTERVLSYAARRLKLENQVDYLELRLYISEEKYEANGDYFASYSSSPNDLPTYWINTPRYQKAEPYLSKMDENDRFEAFQILWDAKYDAYNETDKKYPINSQARSEFERMKVAENISKATKKLRLNEEAVYFIFEEGDQKRWFGKYKLED